MPRPLIASHAVEIPDGQPGQPGQAGAAPEWVHLLPIGRFHGRDGRGPYILRDQAHAADVIQATARFAGKADLPGDYDHQLLYTTENGQPAPASGWIKELQARADGLWGRIGWTAAAAARIAAREYRYVSPVFNHRADGTITRLRAFALTNVPNLDLTALASSAFTEAETEDDAMTEEQLKALRVALGLEATATVEQITAHATGLVAKVKAAETSRLAIVKALGADAKATDEQLAVAAQGLADKAKAAGTGAPDPAKFVPIDAFKELQDKVAAMSTAMTGDKAASAIADAKADGKLSPAMEKWAQDYAAKDLDGFVAWASAAPQIVQPTRTRSATGALPPAQRSGDNLDADETAVCAALGLKPEDYRKSRAELEKGTAAA